MALGFRISVMGEKVAASMIEGLGRQARSPRPALEEIYLTVLDIIDENFDTEGGRGGAPKWQRLSTGYLVQKIKRGGDPRILQSGLPEDDPPSLREAMTTFRHPQQYVRIDRLGVTLAPRQLRGRVHQQGSSSANLPARPFIRFTEDDRLGFAREILRHLMRGAQMAKAGTRIV